MQQSILVIGRNIHPDGKETAQLIADSLLSFAEAQNFSVHYAAFKDLVFDISNDSVHIYDKSGNELKDYSVVLMTNWFSHASIRKDIAYSLALYFEYNNVPYFNQEAGKSRSTSKLSQLVHAAYAGVPIARTVFSLSLHSATRLAENVIGAPFILKDAQASRGKGNYLIKDFADVQSHSNEHSEKHPFVFQQFINSDGSDYRFFVAGDERLVIKRSGTDGSHLNNTSAGGQAELVPLETFDEKTLSYVDIMSKRLYREVTGIDIMFDQNDGTPYFLEANPIPQIATGSFVDEKLAVLTKALIKAAKGRQ